jgi:hypothetical protein
MSNTTLRATLSFACVALAAGLLQTAAAQPPAASTDSVAQIAALKAEIETLKGMLGSQSHTMIDVESHFANLWFAAKSSNWPLATFYLNETRGHLNWSLRVRSVRKLADGSEIDLRPILKGIEETGGLAHLKAAVDKQDGAAFEAGYREMLTQCHACHQAIEKPFLEPQIPTAPATALIDLKKQP